MTCRFIDLYFGHSIHFTEGSIMTRRRFNDTRVLEMAGKRLDIE